MAAIELSRIEVPAGPIDYQDTGGDGPALVFTHGFPMNHLQWRKVIPLLDDQFRCIAPTLPMGAHRSPMKPGTDLTHRGQVAILADFLDALDVDDVVRRTVRLLAQITQQVAIVQYPVDLGACVRHIELVALGGDRGLVQGPLPC